MIRPSSVLARNLPTLESPYSRHHCDLNPNIQIFERSIQRYAKRYSDDKMNPLCSMVLYLVLVFIFFELDNLLALTRKSQRDLSHWMFIQRTHSHTMHLWSHSQTIAIWE